MKRILLFIGLFLLGIQYQSLAAVHLSNDGTGQVGIVPFYSTVDGNETHLRVINTGDQYKAVRVNVRTADITAQPVYSLNVYLRPHDTWRMAMGQQDDFIAAINTDTTCTLGLTDPANQAVDWSNHIWETGFIEVIEMGNISPATIGQYVAENEYCSLIEEAWADGGAWADNPLAGINPVNGELQVTTELINVPDGFSFNIPVTMLVDFYPEGSKVHTSTGSEQPNLGSGTQISRIIYDGNLVETTWQHGYEAVSALLMKETLSNEFNLIEPIGGQTDWIMTFPTLAFHVSSAHFEENFQYPVSKFNYNIFSSEGQDIPLPCVGRFCFPVGKPRINYLTQHTAVYNFKELNAENFTSNLINTSSNNAFEFGINYNSEWLPIQRQKESQSGTVKLIFPSPNPNYPVRSQLVGIDSQTGIQHIYHGLPMIGFAAHFSYNNSIPAVYSRSVQHTATRLITEEQPE
ncbi:MAG: hypothetical protein DWP95_00535 [Proteobacteria bacterium]|nr:MAG: hypothetical protein DWP95_00535 [Pseudomonadota bacterium]